MPDLVRNLIWLDDVHEELTDAHLYAADVEDGIRSAKRSRERSVTPSFEVTMAHPGWALYAPTAKRAAALVLHTDGTMATAEVLARGWVRNLPSAMTGDEITIQIECRDDDDEDLDDRLEAAAQEVVQADMARPDRGFTFPGDGSAKAAPFRDLLFGRLQKLADEVMASRSAWWRYDPVTHDIRMVEDRAPARRRHNIGDGYDPESLQVSEGEGAVYQVKWKLIANVQQGASGTCNLGPLMGTISSLMGYQATAPASLGTNAGWQFGATNLWNIETATSDTAWFDTGRAWDYQTRKVSYVTQGSSGSQTVNTSYGSTFTYTIGQQYQVQQTSYTFLNVPATYSYSQVRREVLTLTLAVPCQQAGGIRRVLDMGETSLGSLYTPVIDSVADQDDDDDVSTELQTPTEMQDGGQYEQGQLAYYGGTLYRATVANPGPLYTLVTKRGHVSTQLASGWAAVGVVAPVKDKSQAVFWETPRGKAAIAHAFRRMAKGALARLYAWTVTVTVQREYLPDLELEDEIALLLPGRWDEPMKPVLGEVKKIEDSWDGDAGDTVTVTLKVAVGDGTDDEADVHSLGGFDGAGFDAAGFEVATPHTTDSDLVRFTLAMGPLDQRINVRRLSDPTYVLRAITVAGSADEQLAECLARAAANQEPAPNNVVTPTAMGLGLVSLASVSSIERTGTAAGQLLYSPRGLEL